jgi:glycerol-3-phosphate dehydrogenase
LCGAHLKDVLTGTEWDVRAKSIVNATGPFTDSIRIMANPETVPICSPSGKSLFLLTV